GGTGGGLAAERAAGEETVGIGEAHGHGAGHPRPAAPDLGLPLLETLRHLDADAADTACRIAERLAPAVDDTRHDNGGTALIDVDLEFDGREQRAPPRLDGGGEDAEQIRAGTALLAAHDTQEGRPLVGIGAFVDDGQHLAAALADGTRPQEGNDRLEAIERDGTISALVDLEGGDATARAVGGQHIELVGTIVGAVAVHEEASSDRPLDGVSHRTLPVVAL